MLLALLALLSASSCLCVPRVLLTDGLAPAGVQRLAKSATVIDRHYTPQELDDGALAEYDAVVIRSATRLTEEAIRAGVSGRLRVIGRAGVGVDNIELEAAAEGGCWVLNTPSASTASVVEMTIAHLLASARGLQQSDVGLKSGVWLKGQLRLGLDGGPKMGHELAGKRIGLLGFGRSAQGVARVASTLGMTVHATSRVPLEQAAADFGVHIEATAEDLFSKCTHVVVLCSLNDETRGLVNRRMLDLMPQANQRSMRVRVAYFSDYVQEGLDGTPCGSHLVNMARGGIVVEEDAAAALNEGQVNFAR
ncbi:MAG: hypothetical protein SGPRY_009224 [Prymnesium sp.]